MEDGLLLTGAWHSSRDGQLGEGPALNQVILSAGDHTLTFTAADSQGVQAIAAVKVRVGPATEADRVRGVESAHGDTAGEVSI